MGGIAGPYWRCWCWSVLRDGRRERVIFIRELSPSTRTFFGISKASYLLRTSSQGRREAVVRRGSDISTQSPPPLRARLALHLRRSSHPLDLTPVSPMTELKPTSGPREQSLLASLLSGSVGGAAQVLVGQPLVRCCPVHLLPVPLIPALTGHDQDACADGRAGRVRRPDGHCAADDPQGGLPRAVQGSLSFSRGDAGGRR